MPSQVNKIWMLKCGIIAKDNETTYFTSYMYLYKTIHILLVTSKFIQIQANT